MDMLNTLKHWIGALTEIVLMLLALGIALALLYGGSGLPFLGSVVTNIIAFVKQLGDNGLVGLIALGIILWLFSHRKLA